MLLGPGQETTAQYRRAGWYIHIFGQSHSQIKLGFVGVKTIHYGTYDRFVGKPFIKFLNINLRTTFKHY